MSTGVDIPKAQRREIFEDAFSTRCSGATRTCHCGKHYHDAANPVDWEEGELERLEKTGSLGVGGSIGGLTFEGKEFASCCDCWHERAERIMDFLAFHDEEIASFLNERKNAIISAANRVKL